MAQIVFHSHDPRFKSPVGAVAAHTVIRVQIAIDRKTDHKDVAMIMVCDATGEKKTVRMKARGHFEQAGAGDYRWFVCEHKMEQSGLFFYHFRVKSSSGSFYVGRSQNGAVVSDTPIGWQQTVYEKDFDTPNWIRGGVIYHIFVDRFHRAGDTPVKEDILYHQDRSDVPLFRPNEEGEVLNNDFYGGNLAGIEEKLPYLKDLGVTCVYLSPIFEAYSNHKYDTGDYTKIDPMFGDEQAFISLCKKAEEAGIRIILDGVFNHTGSDSIYFNKKGRYSTKGAYQSEDSKYASWYFFKKHPDEYECWWGVKTLPKTDDSDESFRTFINGREGIVQKWLKKGAAGWRLDVVDELSDAFVEQLRASAKSVKSDAWIVGEVWEDASHKMAYGKRKRYLLGKQLDSVMNYPFKEAIIGFARDKNAEFLADTVERILENYPVCVVHGLMNIVGTHDTPRILTELSCKPDHGMTKEQKATAYLNRHQRASAIERLKMASLIQITLPGVPCIYYADEVGLEGHEDPFNRRYFPWEHMDESLLDWYKKIIAFRKKQNVFKSGGYRTVSAAHGVFAFERMDETSRVLIGVNASDRQAVLACDGLWQDHLGKGSMRGNITLLAGEMILATKQSPL